MEDEKLYAECVKSHGVNYVDPEQYEEWLEKEITEIRADRDAWKGNCEDMEELVNQLRSQVERLWDWITKNAEHKHNCRYRITGEPDCTCGLDKLLAEGE